jgi:tripartite-type tricarboxylate transporter receptor subunit TctC
MQLLSRCLVLAALAFATVAPASAQSWPTKPVRLIVNFSPGSSPDVVARVYAPPLSEALGRPVVIENRVGGNGYLAIEAVARSAPDGYTLLHTAGSNMVIGPHLYKLNLDLDKDLVPVAPAAVPKTLLVVRPGLPVQSVADLIAYARANPGKLNYGAANGSSLHLAGEMFRLAAKLPVTHIPYKSSAEIVVALLGEQIDFAFDPGPASNHVKSEKLRLLAIASGGRSPVFPNTPTMAEAGTDVDVDVAAGMFAPAGTPREIVTRLNRELGRVMQSAETRSKLSSMGFEVLAASPEDYAARLRRDRERYGVIIREAGIRAD